MGMLYTFDPLAYALNEILLEYLHLGRMDKKVVNYHLNLHLEMDKTNNNGHWVSNFYEILDHH